MRRNTVRLTESQLHRVIKESVKKVLKEEYWSPYDENQKEREKECSWRLLKAYNTGDEEVDRICYRRKPTQSNGNISIHGIARDENWNVQDTHGMNAMNAMSDNPYARHQAQHMGSTLRQSVDNGMDEWPNFYDSKEKI